jgi:hypothetical protein
VERVLTSVSWGEGAWCGDGYGGQREEGKELGEHLAGDWGSWRVVTCVVVY